MSFRIFSIAIRSMNTRCSASNIWRNCGIAAGQRQRFGEIAEITARPDLLYFTMLFHDVGKAEEGNHVSRSLEALKSIARRIHLMPEDFEISSVSHSQPFGNVECLSAPGYYG